MLSVLNKIVILIDMIICCRCGKRNQCCGTAEVIIKLIKTHLSIIRLGERESQL